MDSEWRNSNEMLLLTTKERLTWSRYSTQTDSAALVRYYLLNSKKRFFYEIPESFASGDCVEIRGQATGFKIDVQLMRLTTLGRNLWECPFHFTLYDGGPWQLRARLHSGQKSKSADGFAINGIEENKLFSILLVAANDKFGIYLNQTLLIRLPYQKSAFQSSHLILSGDAEFHSVEFNDWKGDLSPESKKPSRRQFAEDEIRPVTACEVETVAVEVPPRPKPRRKKLQPSAEEIVLPPKMETMPISAAKRVSFQETPREKRSSSLNFSLLEEDTFKRKKHKSPFSEAIQKSLQHYAEEPLHSGCSHHSWLHTNFCISMPSLKVEPSVIDRQEIPKNDFLPNMDVQTLFEEPQPRFQFSSQPLTTPWHPFYQPTQPACEHFSESPEMPDRISVSEVEEEHCVATNVNTDSPELSYEERPSSPMKTAIDPLKFIIPDRATFKITYAPRRSSSLANVEKDRTNSLALVNPSTLEPNFDDEDSHGISSSLIAHSDSFSSCKSLPSLGNGLQHSARNSSCWSSSPPERTMSYPHELDTIPDGQRWPEFNRMYSTERNSMQGDSASVTDDKMQVSESSSTSSSSSSSQMYEDDSPQLVREEAPVIISPRLWLPKIRRYQVSNRRWMRFTRNRRFFLNWKPRKWRARFVSFKKIVLRQNSLPEEPTSSIMLDRPNVVDRHLSSLLQGFTEQYPSPSEPLQEDVTWLMCSSVDPSHQNLLHPESGFEDTFSGEIERRASSVDVALESSAESGCQDVVGNGMDGGDTFVREDIPSAFETLSVTEAEISVPLLLSVTDLSTEPLKVNLPLTVEPQSTSIHLYSTIKPKADFLRLSFTLPENAPQEDVDEIEIVLRFLPDAVISVNIFSEENWLQIVDNIPVQVDNIQQEKELEMLLIPKMDWLQISIGTELGKEESCDWILHVPVCGCQVQHLTQFVAQGDWILSRVHFNSTNCHASNFM